MNYGSIDHHDGVQNTHITLDGTLKAAVFGFSDGLCTNINVILGMYAAMNGATAMTGGFLQARHIITLTGMSGMLGGASSMACGEWLSASAEAQAKKTELEREKWHHQIIPEVESSDMHAMMREAGLSSSTCDSIVGDLQKMPEDERLAFHARFELGIEQEDMTVLSSLKNAAFMWCSFSLGAFIPLVPWVAAPSGTSMFTMFLLSLVATLMAVLATCLFQIYSLGAQVFSINSLVTFIRQIVVVAAAVSVTVGLNVLLTGTVSGTA